MDSFFQKYRMNMFSKCDAAPNHQCILWNMTPNHNGYGVIKFKSPITGQYQTVNAHRLSFMVFNETMDISGMDVSHLCHNRLCMLKDHLSAEPHAVNCSGVACCNRTKCQGHGQYPPCLLHLKL